MTGRSGLSSVGVSRRRFMTRGAGAVTGVGVAAGLGWPSRLVAKGHRLAAPKPIPGGTDLGGFGLPPPYDFIHIFSPGPVGAVLPFTGVPLEGLDVEPSSITDFRGTSAVAYLVGTATGSDGETYNLEADIRAMNGSYVSGDGETRHGSFALI